MKMQPRMIFVYCFTILFTMGLIGAAGAVTFDLKNDWSSTNNPNGVWSLNKGSNPLPLQTNYDSTGQFAKDLKAFAERQFPFAGHVPVWTQATKDNFWEGDFLTGDIVFHPSTPGNTLNPFAESNATWTSTLAGVAQVTGNVWYGGLNQDRGVSWTLYLNESSLTSGSVFNGDSYDRSNPLTFSVPGLVVNPGDVLKFEGVTQTGTIYPWFIGVNLTVDVTPASVVPLPPAVWLFGTGLAGLTLLRFRK